MNPKLKLILIFIIFISLSGRGEGWVIIIIYLMHFLDSYFTHRFLIKLYKKYKEKAFDFELNYMISNVYKKYGLKRGYIISYLVTFSLITLIVVAIDDIMSFFYFYLGMQFVIHNIHLDNLKKLK